MATPIKIDGATVDADNPCAVFQALYALKLKIASGAAIAETLIRDPATQRQIVFHPANMAALETELRRAQAACEASTSGRRARAAISSGWGRL